jgi:radical SAM superfamily enzyme YgiQ (UPF0313 family)
VFGGIHPTSVPDRVLSEDAVDFVIRGEGEEPFLELVEALERGKSWARIENLCFKSDGKITVNPLRRPIADLDTLPFPDKDLFFQECNDLVRQSYMIVASRGCQNSCSYCVNSVLNRIYPDGRYMRRRSVDNVIQELAWAKERYGIRKVTFYDEIFTSDRAWLKDFLTRYRDTLRIPFFCCIHPSTLDEEVVSLLSGANCAAVNIGIQTVSEDLRKRILCRDGSNEEIVRALRLLRKTNIFTYGNVMLGLPAQTEQEVIDTLAFCAENKVDLASTYWLRYYPKTLIVDIARRMNVLSEADVERIETGKDYAPYAIQGSTYSKNLSRIGNLILFSGLMPPPLLRFIVKRRYDRYVPSRNLLFLAILLVGFFKKITQKKKYPFHYLGLFDYVKFYGHYMTKRVFARSPSPSPHAS